MDKIVQRLKLLEQIAKRIEALTSVRGTPADITTRLKSEFEAIQWAHDELLQSNFHRVLCVIGQEDLVREVVDPYIYGSYDSVAWAICIDPDEVLAAKVYEDLVGKKDWPGNRLPDEKNTSWITCDDRYFAVGDDADPTRRALLLNCLVNRPWFSANGADQARLMIGTWLDNLYRSMQWDKHTKV